MRSDENKVVDQMNLYNVQDNDRPMFVLASSMEHAIQKWMALIKKENPELEEVDQPRGCIFLANDQDILI